MRFVRYSAILSSIGLAGMLGACGDGDDKPETDSETVAETIEETTQETTEETAQETTEETAQETTEETSPDAETVEPTYATLTFSIDDSANQTFDASDSLVWKGSFAYDATTRVVSFDSTWSGGAGPYPPLYDDGPAPGGHEKPGATAGDHVWTTALKTPTPTADQEFEYGAAHGEGATSWIWTGPNGKVTVPAGSTAQIDAPGLVIAAHGTIDLTLTIDVSGDGANLHPLFQGLTYTDVKVKGSAWGWREVAMTDDGTKGDVVAGDGEYTFVMSENLGKHDGLLRPGDVAQFVFVLGGVEYKAEGAPPTAGVTAWLGGTEVVVGNLADGDKNTYVEVPTKVELSFTIDDSANKTYTAEDQLEWKGSFTYAAATDLLTFDASWGGGAGPYVPLFDDGPGPAGHEPVGAVAGDSRWSNSVWVSNAAQEFEYGAQRAGGQWIWVGANGKVTVPAGAIAPIVAPGLTIAAFGTIDLRLEIDVSADGANLNALFQGLDYTDKVKVKGSAWGWQEIAAHDDGLGGDSTASDGIYTFVLSQNLGKHEGLLELGAMPEWIFVLDGVEYKNAAGEGAREGVSAFSDYDAAGADQCVVIIDPLECAAETIVTAANKNTAVTIGPD